MKLFTVREAAQAGINIKDKTSVLNLDLGHGMLRLLAESGKVESLRTADIAVSKEGRRIVREARPYDRRALVLLETTGGEGGKLWLSANTVEERIERDRVVRVAKSFEQAVGCSLVTEGEAGKLIEMLPGASFRVCRTGKLEGAPPELVVLWSGRYDPNSRDGGLRVFGRSNRTG